MKKILCLFVLTILCLTGCTLLKDLGLCPHKYEPTLFPPGCTEAGYSKYVCKICGDSYISDFIPAPGHDEEAVSAQEAGCTTDGHTKGVRCSRCNIIVSGIVKVGAKGHSFIEATTEAPKTCKICGATEGEKLPDTPSTPGTDTPSNPGGNTPSTPPDTPTEKPTLTVTYIDVGQGDCALIRLGDCDILIDAGKPDKGTVVSNYLKSLGVDDIELMIATHPDDDHYGGLTQVLSDFKVEAVWGSPFKKSNSSLTKFKNAVSSEGVTLVNPSLGQKFTYEYLTLTVLYDGVGGSDSNNSSLVVMVEYGSFSFLFTGDAEKEVENKLLLSSADITCDVLKVGHHGSKNASSTDFVNALGAEYAVIGVGADNSYGHPTSAALNRILAAGMTVYRTDRNGHVVFSTDGETMTQSCQKGSPTLPSTPRELSESPNGVMDTANRAAVLPDSSYLREVNRRKYYSI